MITCSLWIGAYFTLLCKVLCITSFVDELSGGKLRWTDGMLYPVLHRLERNGLVKASWGRAESGRRRKYYGLTDQGSEELANQQRQWQVVNETLRATPFRSS